MNSRRHCAICGRKRYVTKLKSFAGGYFHCIKSSGLDPEHCARHPDVKNLKAIHRLSKRLKIVRFSLVP